MSNNNSNPVKLLVIGSQRINFYDLFKNVSLKGRFETVEVEQCAWDDLIVCSYGADGITVDIAPSFKPLPNSTQDHARSFQPNFVLFRGSTRGDYSKDWTNQLLAFVHAGIPSLNSLDSFYTSQDKALLYGKLLKVQRKLGKEEFPLVEQTFYPSYKAAGFLPSFPCVVKVGTASGGLGKMKIVDQTAWHDFISVAAMQATYFSSEPFIEWDIDIRIQKIGSHYRCFARKSTNWKSNTGMATEDSDIPVESRYQKWIDAAAEELDMDICAMDVVRRKSDGKEYILEINPSSIGLNPKYQDEDAIHIRDLVIKRIEEMFPKEKSKAKKGFFG